jgi:hypothetical protein
MPDLGGSCVPDTQPDTVSCKTLAALQGCRIANRLLTSAGKIIRQEAGELTAGRYRYGRWGLSVAKLSDIRWTAFRAVH